MGDVLLRVWAEARLEPGDLDHRRRNIPFTLQSEWVLRMDTDSPPETTTVEARIKRVRAKLRDLCAAGTVILWGCLVVDAVYGVLQPIVIQELDWKRVRFLFKTGGLKCRHLEWVNV